MTIERHRGGTVDHRGIEISTTADDERETWDRFVERSPQGTVFHQLDALETIAEHANATLHPLLGRKGQEPVGILPVFEVTRGFLRLAFSPPPEMGLSQLGPAFAPAGGMNSRTAEKRRRRFVAGAVEWIDETIDPSYVHLRTHRQLSDVRPFAWCGFDLTPRYTYVVDLLPEREELLSSFSGDARRNVRAADGGEPSASVRIEERGVGAVEPIVEHLDRRHEEQDLTFPVDTDYASDLYRRLDGRMRAYVCTVDGEYATGMLTLEDDETVYRWQGGARPVVDVDVSVNDLLDWRIMCDAIDRGRIRYDLVGANTRGVADYKAKFAPELCSYHAAERGTKAMQVATGLYRRLR